MKSFTQIRKFFKILKKWPWWTHLYGGFSFIGLVSAIVSLFLYLYFGNNIIKVEANDNVLTLYNKIGKIKIRTFESHINKVVLCDLYDKGKNKIILGFDELGGNKNQIVALNSHKVIWPFTYQYSIKCPYETPADYSFNLKTNDILFTKDRGENHIAVLMGDGKWYQSVLFILSAEGKLLKDFWHPGQLLDIKHYNKGYVVEGVNNDLHNLFPDSAKSAYCHVIFSLQYNHIWRAFPSKNIDEKRKNRLIDWYYYVLPLNSNIYNIRTDSNSVFFWVNDREFRVDKDGMINKIADGDCKYPVFPTM
ncbi:MAG: hypothetical protein ABSD71_09710 [Bacteroidales bacterium]|jgi:hypothetical protein